MRWFAERPRWKLAVLAGAAVALLAVGVGLAAYFAIDGTSVAREGTPVPTPLPRQSAPGVAPTPPPSPTPTPTPTPEPGVCPKPVRATADELGVPPTQVWGERVQGGVAYSAGYVTVRLPAGREFVVLSYWSSDESGLRINIYDVQTESGLDIGGDGCERGRFLRQPAADAVFDEVMRSLEMGATYACPIPVRTTPEDLPVPDSLPPLPDRRVQGGVPFELGPITLHLPAGREFVVGGGVSDPGGMFFTVSDVQTRSGLFLRPDGCETSRLVRDPAADAILDEIVATLEVRSR